MLLLGGWSIILNLILNMEVRSYFITIIIFNALQYYTVVSYILLSSLAASFLNFWFV